jgi:hypothetical protein
MLTDDKQRASLLAEAPALLQQELSEHRTAFEATALMLGGPFVETLGILERGVRGGQVTAVWRRRQCGGCAAHRGGVGGTPWDDRPRIVQDIGKRLGLVNAAP